MAKADLYVLIAGVPAGILSQDAAGMLSFRYSENYSGVPLSLSMPIQNRTYHQNVVAPYLFGLLPDSEEQRKAIAREFECSPNNPFALLSHIGLDCPGAIQFCQATEEALVATLERGGSYEPLSDATIARRLKETRSAQEETWVARGESWSLGGNQGKFALALRDGVWCSCLGAAPTTHIFKNGVIGYKLQALNEFVCLRIAEKCGLAAAKVVYRLLGNEPALIVRRFDRTEKDNLVLRLHFEDLCQSLSVLPSEKYTSDGGPSVYDVLELLTCTGAATDENLVRFTQYLFFNCLIGAPDAHAKNYSLQLQGDGQALLAPMYDVASGLAYEGMARKGRLAMAIGGENRFGRVGKGAIARFAAKGNEVTKERMALAGLDATGCLELMAHLAEAVPTAMESVFEEGIDIPGMEELREHMLEPVKENCQRSLALL